MRVVEVYSYESTFRGQVKVILIKDIHDFFLKFKCVGMVVNNRTNSESHTCNKN